MVTFVNNINCYDGIIYFKDWLKNEGHCQRDEFICIMCSEGKTTDEIEDIWNKLEEQFQDWCNDNGVQGETE